MPENIDRIRELMVELITVLPGYEPLEIPKEPSNAGERMALANMYKDRHFRDYMARTIRMNVSKFQDVTGEISLSAQQARLLVLKELFMLSKQMFEQAEKIDKTFKEDIETKG